MSRIFPALLLSLALLSPAMPLQAAEGLPATPQAAVDALSLERDIHTLMRDKKALASVSSSFPWLWLCWKRCSTSRPH